MSNIKVMSEVGKLKKMIVHRPSEELNNLTPHFLNEQLFDDIPWLKVAQIEHDEYVKTLKSLDVDVLYIENLIVEAMEYTESRQILLNRFIDEANIYSESERKYLYDYLLDIDVKDMVKIMIGGLRKSEIKTKSHRLADYISGDYPFILSPMPNMYFTRDPFSFIGNGVAISKMFMTARIRETLFGDFIVKNHPLFKLTKRYYERTDTFSIEGGDIMVIGNGYVAVGISQRTSANAVEELAKNLLNDEESGFRGVLAIDIPKIRSYMHLDTVFTMVDKDAFIVHPGIQQCFKAFTIEKKKGELVIKEQTKPLNAVLADILNLDNVRFIKCGGSDQVDSAREQWSDGANTLAVAPGEVIVYARNQFSNKMLVDNGIKIHEIPCSELSRGRGGPHCMSMAVYREDLH